VLCLVWNLQHTSVGFASTLLNLAPIVVVLLGAILGEEKLRLRRCLNILFVVLASILFWHGSSAEASMTVWMVGLTGMCAAAVAYAMTKILPPLWSPLDMTWCLSLAELPVTLLFKRGPWIFPTGQVFFLVAAVCVLSLMSNALTNFSFRHLELSTATALIPSCIIWGVMLELLHGQFPLIQGVSGCLLYLFATVSLATQPSEATIEAPAESKIIEQVLP
jgi:drug/metabolite transporter (DMT)-like permease